MAEHDRAFGPAPDEYVVTVGVQTTGEQLEAFAQLIASDVITGGFRTIKPNLFSIIGTLNYQAQQAHAARQMAENAAKMSKLDHEREVADRQQQTRDAVGE